MKEGQHAELLDLLSVWVRTNPEPDQPAISVMGRSYSPAEILEEVRERSDLGELLGDMLYTSSERFRVSVIELIERAIKANSQLKR
jgi:hypothetical protein